MQKKEKVYDYFISFHFETKKRQYGWGNGHIVSDKKITNYGVIRELSERLKEDANYHSVVITNYILLK